MNMKNKLVLLGLIFLQSSFSMAIELKSSDNIKIGDFLLTKQENFGFHAGVVVFAPENATVDSLDDVILADHALRKEGHGPDGVHFVWLKDFIIEGIFWSNQIPEEEKSKAFIIVARAVSALFSNAIYDIAKKNCGGFAEWCINGAKSGFSDFRKPESFSFNREMRLFRSFCDGTDEGKKKLVESVGVFDENYAKTIENLPTGLLWSLGDKCEDGEKNLAEFIKSKSQGSNFAVRASNKNNISLGHIVFAALSLDKEFIGISEIQLNKLLSMKDEQILDLCSQIVDGDISGNYVDVTNIP